MVTSRGGALEDCLLFVPGLLGLGILFYLELGRR